MSELIPRQLIYRRVGCGAVRIDRCDGEAILDSVLHRCAALLNSAAATVTHDPLPVVPADAVLMAELLQNLLENAIKYRSPARPPRIHLSAERQRGEWVLSFRDNGVGIRAADQQAIFRPFTQARRAGTRADGGAGGVGLGLATCKRIAERHGGRMWVESVVGEGSTFFVSLPEDDKMAR
jgi:signal transduction histidine kinase